MHETPTQRPPAAPAAEADIRPAAETDIRPAAEADLPAILALTHRAYARNLALGFRFWGTHEPMETLEQDWREMAVYTLTVQDRLVGSVRLQAAPEGWLYVHRLTVDPAYQRRGLGRRLMAFAEAEARRRGLDRLRLDTAQPFTELVRWYEGQGFQVVEEADWPETNYRSVIMEKRLDPAPPGPRPHPGDNTGP